MALLFLHIHSRNLAKALVPFGLMMSSVLEESLTFLSADMLVSVKLISASILKMLVLFVTVSL